MSIGTVTHNVTLVQSLLAVSVQPSTPIVPTACYYSARSYRLSGKTLADFGRDPRSSDSWRARRNFVFFLSGKQRTISPISRQPNFPKFEHNTSIGVAMKTVDRGSLEIFTIRVVFPKQCKNFSKFLTSCDFRPP